MKKLIILLSLAATLLFPIAFAGQAMAVDVLSGPCSPSTSNGTTPLICQDRAPVGSKPIIGPNGIMTVVIRILSLIVGIGAIIVIIISALRMVTSGGDPNTVNSARNGIIYALVGIAVAALGEIIVAFVLDKVK